MFTNKPSIRPYHAFNSNFDAEKLHKAMKGIGCKKDKIIDVLCERSNWQRQEIAEAYKVMYGKDLIHELKSELSGDFETFILALMEIPSHFDAHQLHKAIAGIGTKESVLIEIMTTRTNDQIRKIKAAYNEMFHHSLEHDIIGDTSGPFQNILISLCQGERDESHHTDHHKAKHDAQKLYRAGETRLGKDDSCFNIILGSQNFAQLYLIFDEYEHVAEHSIEKAIETEFKGDIRDALLAIIKVIRNRSSFFAELLYNSMKGMGTRDNDLIRLIVSRSEIDLRDIAQVYQQKYEKSLEDAIKGDCSGAYKDGLTALVKGNF
jgi:hypothetical protein